MLMLKSEENLKIKNFSMSLMEKEVKRLKNLLNIMKEFAGEISEES